MTPERAAALDGRPDPASTKPRVKVLHFLPWLLSGGVERRRLLLARGLDKARYDQRIAFFYGAEHLVEEFAEAGVAVSPIGGARLDRSTLLRAVAMAGEWKPDIIHGAVFEGVIMAALAGIRCPRAKVILEETGFPVEQTSDRRLNRSKKARWLFRALALRASRCVAVSPSIMGYFASEGISPAKQRLIMNAAPVPAVPPREDWPRIRRELGIPVDAFVVGSVGRIHDDHKRFSDLIRSVEMLRPLHPDVHLLIVGDGGDLAALEALARDLGVEPAVTFAGYRSDVGPMYAAMDLFALASVGESFGLVLVEAMYAGLAVVATRTIGIVDVVDEGVTGLLVPVRAPAELARAIASLKGDAARRRSMGEAGRARALVRFGAERYVADVARLYEEVLRGAER